MKRDTNTSVLEISNSLSDKEVGENLNRLGCQSINLTFFQKKCLFFLKKNDTFLEINRSVNNQGNH